MMFEETLEGVDKLYREGKFKVLGLSNYPAWEVAEIVGVCERRYIGCWSRKTVKPREADAITEVS